MARTDVRGYGAQESLRFDGSGSTYQVFRCDPTAVAVVFPGGPLIVVAHGRRMRRHPECHISKAAPRTINDAVPGSGIKMPSRNHMSDPR